MSDQQQHETVSLEFYYGNPSAGPFRDWEDYQARGTLYGTRRFKRCERRGRWIYYPESIPDYPRATLQEVEAAVDDLPDKGYGNCLVVVLDHDHPHGPWLAQTGRESPMSSHGATAVRCRLPHPHDPEVALTLFRPTSKDVGDALLRAWFMGWRLSASYEAYEYFHEATRKFGLLRSGAKTFTNEDLQADWNSLGYALFSPRDGFAELNAVLETCIAYPLRCAMVGWAMDGILSPGNVDGPMARHYRDRAGFIELSAATLALKRAGEDPEFLPNAPQGLDPTRFPYGDWLVLLEGLLPSS